MQGFSKSFKKLERSGNLSPIDKIHGKVLNAGTNSWTYSSLSDFSKIKSLSLKGSRNSIISLTEPGNTSITFNVIQICFILNSHG